MNFDFLSIKDIQNGLERRDFSCRELTDSYLQKIAKQNTDLNAYLVINNNVLQEAEDLDRRLIAGENIKPLMGVPVAIKDVIVTKDLVTTAGSLMLKSYQPPYDATVVSKIKERNGLILGKVNCDEFAMGSSNENSAYGPVRNPHNLDCVPGGSSGGSAAAVAADLCAYSLGTDTGGSVRQPASFCGVVGVKPTYGRVSRYGLIAMTSSFDQVGPLCRSVADAAYVLECIAGPDNHDSTTSSRAVDLYSTRLSNSISGMRLALPKQFLAAGLHPSVRKALEQSIALYESMGVSIYEIDLPLLEQVLAIYYIIMPAEVSANLARFDGIRFGQTAIAQSLWEGYKKTRAQGFGNEVKRRNLIGTYVLSAGYYDAYYKKALLVQRQLKIMMDRVWQKYDGLIGPTTPTSAFRLGEKTDDPLTMYLSDIYTVGANIIGAPAISLPVAWDSQNLPIGLQITTQPFSESKMFSLAWHLEQKLAQNWQPKKT